MKNDTGMKPLNNVRLRIYFFVFFLLCGFSVLMFLHEWRGSSYFLKAPKPLPNLPRSEYALQAAERSPWTDCPTLELVVRMNSNPVFVKMYQRWFLKSLKYFWPPEWMNLTVVLDAENPRDVAEGKILAAAWPYPKVVLLEPGDANIYQHNQRRRMFLDYFYPEKYVTAEYVGFVDADTMFVTTITPQSLFSKGKPTVQARIGKPFVEQGWACWAVVSEFMIGKKEVLQCMSYFPVIIKVQHILQMREYIEKKFGKSFLEVFNQTIRIENPAHKDYQLLNDCMCQFSIICNYIWYFHQEEYDFHLQMTPNDAWKGEHRLEAQASVEYFRNIDAKHRIPKPRVAIHARHYMEGGHYISGSDAVGNIMLEPQVSHLNRRLREGICHSIGLEYCPERCYEFHETQLQGSLYSFETFEWFWDKRCLAAQERHYFYVKKLMNHRIKHGMPVCSLQTPSQICSIL